MRRRNCRHEGEGEANRTEDLQAIEAPLLSFNFNDGWRNGRSKDRVFVVKFQAEPYMTTTISQLKHR